MLARNVIRTCLLCLYLRPVFFFLPEKSEFEHIIIDFKISSENKINQFHSFQIFNIKKENRM